MKYLVRFLTLLAASNVLPMCHAQTFNVIYTFPSESVGYEPSGVPYIGAGGVLFGTTAFGGPNTPCKATAIGCGTVFSLTPPAHSGDPWSQSILYGFSGVPDGGEPATSVLPGGSGTLLGTTSVGGPATLQCRYGCGTLFQLTPPTGGGAWTEELVYEFLRVDEFPGSLLADSNGVLFGAAAVGGNTSCSLGCGSIYELFPSTGGNYNLTPIHQFSASAGYDPTSPLVAGANGVLYGTTENGGNNSAACGSLGCGGVFSLTPPVPPANVWAFHDIHRFNGGTDGYEPSTGLLVGPDGTLYGTTRFGGTKGCAGGGGCGTVFSLTQSGGPWIKRTLYSFQGGSDGNYPISGAGNLVIAAGGVIYGVTSEGGGTACNGQGCGTLFQLTPPAVPGGSWKETILHAFTGGVDGENPFSGPAIDPTGVLYGFADGGSGTSCSGGGCGVVYQYVP